MTTPDLWVFGYGSLIWKPGIPFVESRRGFIRDWNRRFWQGSTDHRGTPADPGRVVTLIREPGAVCWGVGFRIAPTERDAVVARLDVREKQGYDQTDVTLHAGDAAIAATAYVATEDNENFLGPAPVAVMAAQIHRCAGPSGANREYALELAGALRDIGAEDPHVFELEAALLER